jgi:hypothetical protein
LININDISTSLNYKSVPDYVNADYDLSYL